MVAQQLAVSAKNLVTVRQRESATGIRATETEKRTEIATATVTAYGNGTETGTGIVIVKESPEIGTEIMIVTGIVTATATVIGIGTESETATVIGIVRKREGVAPGTIVGMMTRHDGRRVTTVAIVNGIGKVTRHETVVTETAIGMPRKDQARKGRTGNGVQEGTMKTEAAAMSHERSRSRTMSEVRKERDTIPNPLHLRTERVGLKHQRRERYDSFAFLSL